MCHDAHTPRERVNTSCQAQFQPLILVWATWQIKVYEELDVTGDMNALPNTLNPIT